MNNEQPIIGADEKTAEERKRDRTKAFILLALLGAGLFVIYKTPDY